MTNEASVKRAFS